MEVMPWVAKLNDVPPSLLAQREAIKTKMLQAIDLELQASVVRGAAYQEALELTSRLGVLYPEEQIKEAQAT